MAAFGQAGHYPRESNRPGRRLDAGLLVSALILFGMGLLTLYSQSQSRNHPTGQFGKQVLNAVIGLLPFALFAFVNLRVWQRLMPVIYGLNLVLLVAVLRFGSKILGATRWIPIGPVQFQPSEIAKLFLVLTLAGYLAVNQDRIQKVSTFLLSLVHIAVPVFLVYKQPHLGAVLVMVVIWFCVAIAGNMPAKFLLAAASVLVLAGVVVLSNPSLKEKFLQPYQAGRVGSLGGHNVKGGNYQTYQAEIAFGVGGVNGTGFLKGTQKNAGYIPEQENDFIFSVIGEEGGLIGCFLVLAAFGFFLFRIWLVMFQATEPYHRMLAAGVLGILSFHMLVNMAMVLGLIPVVGLWLPFFSAGGTALWLCMACVGLILNVRSRERPVLFS